MFAFASFLTEQKNLHMEHLEDEILNGGVEGTRAAIKYFVRIAAQVYEGVGTSCPNAPRSRLASHICRDIS